MSGSTTPIQDAKPMVIGALLLERGLITQQDLDKALVFQAQFKGRLGSILIRMGALSEDALLPVLSEQVGLPLADGDQIPSHAAPVLNAIQTSGLAPDWFVDQQLAVWEDVDGAIQCASRNPINSYLQETLAAAFGEHRQAWNFIRSQDLERVLKLVEQSAAAGYEDEVAHLRELATSSRKRSTKTHPTSISSRRSMRSRCATGSTACCRPA